MRHFITSNGTNQSMLKRSIKLPYFIVGTTPIDSSLKKNLNAPRPSEHPPVWGKLSPTHGHKADKSRSNQFDNKPKCFNATHYAEIRKIVIPRALSLEALSW